MSVLIKDMGIPKCCAECVAGMYEYNDNDERCFVCGFIKSQHSWECEHAEIDGIDTTKMRAYFCPIAEVATPHWIPVTERLPETTDAVLTTYIVNGDRSRRYVEESSYYGNDELWSSPWDEYRVAGTRIEVIAWMPLPTPYKQ